MAPQHYGLSHTVLYAHIESPSLLPQFMRGRDTRPGRSILSLLFELSQFDSYSYRLMMVLKTQYFVLSFSFLATSALGRCSSLHEVPRGQHAVHNPGQVTSRILLSISHRLISLSLSPARSSLTQAKARQLLACANHARSSAHDQVSTLENEPAMSAVR